MNIIIEGCDRLGKTTLVNNLKCLGKFETFHYGPPPKAEKVDNYEYQKYLYAASIDFLNSTNNIICDRFILGEAVYSPIFRGYYPFYIRELEKKLKFNTIMVVLDGTYDLVMSRYDGIFIKPEHIQKILDGFRLEFQYSNIRRKFLINVEHKTEQEVLFEFLEQIRKHCPSDYSLLCRNTVKITKYLNTDVII